ncbi:hypothetical protein AVDCRST_MAG92-268 [uncultured Coleofasciculus sp.]|uniref:Uncharacterized protein n=1 Tax=uncultured Coleofasciculus sp. TaxID=1267456 RepID=A0A6J4H7D6_9CYAN|nr:hypothetical protein AVDCRST_MAG92-268 [uncultured Coleofasciculus sp.]
MYHPALLECLAFIALSSQIAGEGKLDYSTLFPEVRSITLFWSEFR